VKPEEKAREEIDRQLSECGWHVQNFSEMNLSAGSGIAVREFFPKRGFADYLLYVDAKAIGVVEAKALRSHANWRTTKLTRHGRGNQAHCRTIGGAIERCPR